MRVVGELEVSHGVHAELQRDGARRRVEAFDIGHPLNGIGIDREPQITRVVQPEALVEDWLRLLENVVELREPVSQLSRARDLDPPLPHVVRPGDLAGRPVERLAEVDHLVVQVVARAVRRVAELTPLELDAGVAAELGAKGVGATDELADRQGQSRVDVGLALMNEAELDGVELFGLEDREQIHLAQLLRDLGRAAVQPDAELVCRVEDLRTVSDADARREVELRFDELGDPGQDLGVERDVCVREDVDVATAANDLEVVHGKDLLFIRLSGNVRLTSVNLRTLLL